MVNTGKAGEDAVADPGKLAEVEGKRRLLEGVIAVYELGVEFERHGRDRRRSTPEVLLEHFGVAYAEGARAGTRSFRRAGRLVAFADVRQGLLICARDLAKCTWRCAEHAEPGTR